MRDHWEKQSNSNPSSDDSFSDINGNVSFDRNRECDSAREDNSVSKSYCDSGCTSGVANNIVQKKVLWNLSGGLGDWNIILTY